VKNLLVGIGNGLATGTIAALVAWIMNGDFRLGLILALAMLINLFVAGLVGTLIPLGLKALKIDPALASAVFITTFTDVCGFASFLGLATLYTRYMQGTG
jgi:magnesium transporter